VVVADAAGRILFAAGDPDLPLFLRSAAKPFQAVPLVESGAADRVGLTDPELAVVCGSHSGEPVHLDAVRSILSKAGVPERALQCGVTPPLGAVQAAALAAAGRAPEPIHNNCSGKHAGMLAACRVNGWPIETYREPDHPLQRQILDVVAAFCGAAPDRIALGIDGCGVPTFHGTVRRLAAAFARLADPSGLEPARGHAARHLTRAMAAHPHMVAGTGRLDTILMSALGGRVFCKSGAEAGFGLGVPDRGWGMAVKIEDGNARGMGAAVVEALRQTGLVDDAALGGLSARHRPAVRDTRAVSPASCGRCSCWNRCPDCPPRPRSPTLRRSSKN
jgi:L-asparaginase II